jgi:hypothetical protein
MSSWRSRSHDAAGITREAPLAGRGRGDFPPAAVRVEDRSRLYRWSQISEWAHLDSDEIERALSIAVVNARLLLGLWDSARARALEKELAESMSA